MSLSPSELEKAIEQWVDYYNERRFHESLDNLTPRDVYLGLSDQIKKIREITKQKSIKNRIYKNKMMKISNKVTIFAGVHFCLTTYRFTFW